MFVCLKETRYAVQLPKKFYLRYRVMVRLLLPYQKKNCKTCHFFTSNALMLFPTSPKKTIAMETPILKKFDSSFKKELLLFFDDLQVRPASGSQGESKAQRYYDFLQGSLRCEDKNFSTEFFRHWLVLLKHKNTGMLTIAQTIQIYKLWKTDSTFIPSFCKYFSRIKIKDGHLEFMDALLTELQADQHIRQMHLDIFLELFKEVECKIENFQFCMKVLDTWKAIKRSLNYNRRSFSDTFKSANYEREYQATRNIVSFVKANLFETQDDKIDFLLKEFKATPRLSYSYPLMAKREEFFSQMNCICEIPIAHYRGKSLSGMYFLSNLYTVCPDFFNSRFNWLKTTAEVEVKEDLLSTIFQNYHFPMVLLNPQFHSDTDGSKLVLAWLLSGNNIRKYPKLPFTLSQKAAHFIGIYHQLQEEIPFPSKLSNYNLNRLMYYAQLRVNGASPEYADLGSRLLEGRPDFADKDMWIGVLGRLSTIGITSSSLIECLDYLLSLNDVTFLKNISLSRLLANVSDWHTELRLRNEAKRIPAHKLPFYGLKAYRVKMGSDQYLIKQIKTTKELYLEGRAMCHCVYTYQWACRKKASYIFSLQKAQESKDFERVLTIEISSDQIVQLRGKHNRRSTELERSVVEMWAHEKGLGIAV